MAHSFENRFALQRGKRLHEKLSKVSLEVFDVVRGLDGVKHHHQNLSQHGEVLEVVGLFLLGLTAADRSLATVFRFSLGGC